MGCCRRKRAARKGLKARRHSTSIKDCYNDTARGEEDDTTAAKAARVRGEMSGRVKKLRIVTRWLYQAKGAISNSFYSCAVIMLNKAIVLAA